MLLNACEHEYECLALEKNFRLPITGSYKELKLLATRTRANRKIQLSKNSSQGASGWHGMKERGDAKWDAP